MNRLAKDLETLRNLGASEKSMNKINDALYPASVQAVAALGEEAFLQQHNESVDEGIIRSLLGDIIGEDIDREGLQDTPARVVKAWRHWCGGYKIDVQQLIKAFSDGAEHADEMVVRKGIRIYSHCEHHLAAIIGECTIAYIPNGRVIGLSKLDRVADAFARRLQVQERLTSQIADALMDGLQPLGVGVYITARHMCIESRGVQQHNSDTATTALRGVIKTEASARAEFLALTR